MMREDTNTRSVQRAEPARAAPIADHCRGMAIGASRAIFRPTRLRGGQRGFLEGGSSLTPSGPGFALNPGPDLVAGAGFESATSGQIRRLANYYRKFLRTTVLLGMERKKTARRVSGYRSGPERHERFWTIDGPWSNPSARHLGYVHLALTGLQLTTARRL